MDQPGLNRATHRRALEGLRKTNLLSGTARFVWQELRNRGLLTSKSRPLRILDVAAGGGDVVIRLVKLAARHGTAVEAHGCDINTTAVDHARGAAGQIGLTTTKFFQLDALNEHLPEGYDVMLCTLFLHHLLEADAEKLLRRMAQSAGRCVLVDDLRRSRLGYMLAWAGPRLLTRSPIVHTDGPLSVRAAFSVTEVRRIAEKAGLCDAALTLHWPQRFMLSWMKNAPTAA